MQDQFGAADAKVLRGSEEGKNGGEQATEHLLKKHIRTQQVKIISNWVSQTPKVIQQGRTK